ncbi:MAG: LPP20 family lipoprotein [Candidatus Scalindua sp.]|nr:LPP20 family lipoprotein [Candidatus Scalindua sp.]
MGNSCIYSVGIAERYSDDNKSFSAAREDGVANLIRSVNVRIRSGSAQYAEGSSIKFKEFVVEEVDSELHRKVDDRAVVLDSLLVRKQAIVLIGWRKERSGSPDSCAIPKAFFKIIADQSMQPRWVHSDYHKEGYIYGIGMSKAFSGLARSWNESAKNGRLEIAKQISVSLSNLEYHYNDGRNFENSWMDEAVDVILDGARVAKRYYDIEQDIYYTLVEYPYKE